MGKIADSWQVLIIMTLLTIYALFFDDIRIVHFSKESDQTFYGIATFVFACFVLEIITSSMAKKGYLWSFFFWLDLIATISMVPDCGWMNAAISDSDQGG